MSITCHKINVPRIFFLQSINITINSIFDQFVHHITVVSHIDSTANTKPSLYFFFPILLSLCFHLISICAATSPKYYLICKFVVTHGNGSFLHNTAQDCHSVFETDPQSRTADIDGLGIVAANIMARSTASVAANIKHVIYNGSLNSKQEAAGQLYIDIYESAVPTLKSAVEAIKNKNYTKSSDALWQAWQTVAKCEDEVKDDENDKTDNMIMPFLGFFCKALWVAAAMGEFLL